MLTPLFNKRSEVKQYNEAKALTRELEAPNRSWSTTELKWPMHDTRRSGYLANLCLTWSCSASVSCGGKPSGCAMSGRPDDKP